MGNGVDMGKQILLIEDDVDNRELTRDLLEEEGYVVLSAENGRQALECLRANPETCAILLDLRMPEMDGFEFRAEQLRDPVLARIPVIACTADAHVEKLVAQLDLAATIRKPFAIEQLLEALRLHAGS